MDSQQEEIHGVGMWMVWVVWGKTTHEDAIDKSL
jgi:hypothetical protein